jgi:hypothetical protein
MIRETVFTDKSEPPPPVPVKMAGLRPGSRGDLQLLADGPKLPLCTGHLKWADSKKLCYPLPFGAPIASRCCL